MKNENENEIEIKEKELVAGIFATGIVLFYIASALFLISTW